MTTNADDYVHETHSSADERRPSDSELNDEESNSNNFFLRRIYTCKADIVVAFSDYITRKLVGRDYRRYRVACANKQCEFFVNFALGREFMPPREFRRYTCDPTKVDDALYDARRALKAQSISRNKVVHQFVVDKAGRPARARFKIFFAHLALTSATTLARTPAQL
uniref:AlNc14C172G8040 protein n=1 Tax=Albugo laibachii Nc14 TaxID=890382 RepID=F0WNL7_9STRA|nr:AlNc14C172G8040 [Albugo laibachii Nc14]|eukprot:CCA22908.1 AlNc14C172G8040 [Albugo laibachii Nc14]